MFDVTKTIPNPLSLVKLAGVQDDKIVSFAFPAFVYPSSGTLRAEGWRKEPYKLKGKEDKVLGQPGLHGVWDVWGELLPGISMGWKKHLTDHVVVRMNGFGECVVGPWGARCQYAQVTEIVVSPARQDTHEALRKTYGNHIPVRYASSEVSMLDGDQLRYTKYHGEHMGRFSVRAEWGRALEVFLMNPDGTRVTEWRWESPTVWTVSIIECQRRGSVWKFLDNTHLVQKYLKAGYIVFPEIIRRRYPDLKVPVSEPKPVILT